MFQYFSLMPDLTKYKRSLNERNLSLPKIILERKQQTFNFSLTMLHTKKAKRVRFYRNGDKFFNGIVFAVTSEKYRNFDSLINDLTRAFISNITLPQGVRVIFTMEGKKVQNIEDLEDGKSYVVSGQNEVFKKIDYSSVNVKKVFSLSGLQTRNLESKQSSSSLIHLKARIITLIRNGIKPRKIVRLLLNKRNSPTIEHVYEAITKVIKLDSGVVKKVYSLSGQHITFLEQFFDSEKIFIIYGLEKPNYEDFQLDIEEKKCVQSFYKGYYCKKKLDDYVPKMPVRGKYKKSQNNSVLKTTCLSSLKYPNSLSENFIIGQIIGEGNFAIVKNCIHKTSGTEFAIKIIDKVKCQGRETMLAREVAILRQIRHPNIINLMEQHESEDHLFLVMEFVEGGDLFDAIAAATKFSEIDSSLMLRHLCYALSYLHSHNIVHRDVKPENLLVRFHGNRIHCLKLADFGLAQVVQEPLFSICGTPTYVAPEILAEVGYGLKVDIWAAGVILYILLCGFPPFASTCGEQEKLFESILSGQYEYTSPYWDNIAKSAKELINNMLQSQPELRFSAEDVLDHLWFSEQNNF